MPLLRLPTANLLTHINYQYHLAVVLGFKSDALQGSRMQGRYYEAQMDIYDRLLCNWINRNNICCIWFNNNSANYPDALTHL